MKQDAQGNLLEPESGSDGKGPQRRSHYLLAGLVLCLLYAVHLAYCKNSALPYMTYVSTASDMYSNWVWAKTIDEQGWLNPVPHHPHVNWMQDIAPYWQWVQWWGGEQIFQQSPLYTYLLALSLRFSQNLFFAHVANALMSAALCGVLGLLTARVAGRAAGWVAFGLAALYAPFYAHSWPLLRDVLGWLVTAALLRALVELTQADWKTERSRWLGWTVGALLGIGYLARETYLLFVPAVWLVLAVFAWKRKHFAPGVRVAAATVLFLLPLPVRNYCVGAPLLASSNRFAEVFISGNSATAHPHVWIPSREMITILRETGGKTLPVVRASLASHRDGWRGWLRLQGLKMLSLGDPYESIDNQSIYFMEKISPLVRFGLKYWMVLTPALGGLALSLCRRDRAHLWLWLFLPMILAGVMVSTPVSRYRHSLSILLIPWAAYFLVYLWERARRRQFYLAGALLACLGAGWLCSLGPLARRPRQEYERLFEYRLAIRIHEALGQEEQAHAMRELLLRVFPNWKP